MLVLDARSGHCSALAGKLGLALGALRLYHAQGQPRGSVQGTAIDVEGLNYTAAAAAAHMLGAFKRVKG